MEISEEWETGKVNLAIDNDWDRAITESHQTLFTENNLY
jgi:hypothetical protein